MGLLRNDMLYQNLNAETIVAIAIWFIVMCLFAVTLIAGLSSILSEHRKKIAVKLKGKFKILSEKQDLKSN